MTFNLIHKETGLDFHQFIKKYDPILKDGKTTEIDEMDSPITAMTENGDYTIIIEVDTGYGRRNWIYYLNNEEWIVQFDYKAET